MITFTPKIVSDMSERGIKSLRFYLSETIVLVRNGDIENPPASNDIVIDSNTSGKLLGYELLEDEQLGQKMILYIGFEKLANGVIPQLMFSTAWNPLRLYHFSLSAEYKKPYYTVNYNGIEYTVGGNYENITPDGLIPYLCIKETAIRGKEKRTIASRKVRGL
jgi:hypothetical protein